jgi:hypothetical protein
MKRTLEQDASERDKCQAASEQLLQLSRQWMNLKGATNFIEEQVCCLFNAIFSLTMRWNNTQPLLRMQ